MVESRVATQQGQDIGRLTRLTVVSFSGPTERRGALTTVGLLTPESKCCKLYLI